MNKQDAVIALVHLASIQMEFKRNGLGTDSKVIDSINEKSLKITNDL